MQRHRIESRVSRLSIGVESGLNANRNKLSATDRMPLSVSVFAVLALLTSFCSATLRAQQRTPITDQDDLEEIVVTATRREEVLSRVPISVSALSQNTLNKQGVHNVQELIAFVPGLQADPISNTIAIRGISTGAGPSTTGLYIDDTPIQQTNIGDITIGATPIVFDTQRIEVLRGPQGTLFGAGAEGGAVRFITIQPSLTDFSSYFKSDVYTIQNGGFGWELGAVAGGPIIKDELGFRVGASYRALAGWIDRIDYDNGAVLEKDSNQGGQSNLKVAITFVPFSGLTITPSVLYQRVHSHDGFPDHNAFSTYWSNLASSRFAVNLPLGMPFENSYWLPALSMRWDLPEVSVFSNTSYFDRQMEFKQDYTLYLASLFGAATPRGLNLPTLPGYTAQGDEQNSQDDFSQEFRAQSSDPDARLRWLAGVFFSKTQQDYLEILHDPMANEFTEATTGQSIEELLGFPLVPPDISFGTHRQIDREQWAVFADVTWKFTDRLALNVGARMTRATFDFSSHQYGPYGGGDASITNGATDSAVTPKVTLTYQTDHNLFYGTVAKGVRPGGGNRPVPIGFCGPDLERLGLTASPTTYDPDLTWSYEIGAKNNLFGGALQLATSAYWIEWRNIQTDFFLPTCGADFTANAGEARSKGFDLQADYRIGHGFSLGLSTGYNKANYTKTILSGPESIVVSAGDSLGTPPWTAALSGTYQGTVGTLNSYARVDYLYSAGYKSSSPSTNPANSVYLAGTILPPTIRTVNLRFGAEIGSWEVSLYSSNVTNSQPVLTNVPGPLSVYGFEYSQTTIQPRMIGITIIGKY
jgi:iron complex outermembrane recepter protein